MASASGAGVSGPVPGHCGQHPDGRAAQVAVGGLVLYLVDGLAYFQAGRVLPVGSCRVHGFFTSRFFGFPESHPGSIQENHPRAREGESEVQRTPSWVIEKEKCVRIR